MSTVSKFLNQSGWMIISKYLCLPVKESKMLMKRQFTIFSSERPHMLRTDENYLAAFNYYQEYIEILND